MSDAPTEEAEATKTVADPETYRAALEGWLVKQLPERDGLRVTEVDIPRATGFSNETVFVHTAWQEGGAERTEQFVARIEPVGGVIFPAQTKHCGVSAEVQYRAMAAVAKASDAPVPPTLPFEPDPSILGRPFFLMSFVDGVIPADVPRYSQAGFLVDEATPADRTKMIRSGVETMAQIHAIDWTKADLDWLDPTQGGTPTFRDQLRIYRDEVVRALGPREHPVLSRSLDWLDANAPDAPVGLSWGDARLGNMIWRDYECVAVVDWDAAAICPPEADIGWWVMFDRMSFDDFEAPRLEGVPPREEMVSIWESATGRQVADTIDYWEIYAVMRFCLVMVHLGDRIVAAGVAPPDNPMWIDNMVTTSLDTLLSRQGG